MDAEKKVNSTRNLPLSLCTKYLLINISTSGNFPWIFYPNPTYKCELPVKAVSSYEDPVLIEYAASTNVCSVNLPQRNLLGKLGVRGLVVSYDTPVISDYFQRTNLWRDI